MSGNRPSAIGHRSSVIGDRPSALLHRYAQFLTACTVVLIAAGGMVTSTDSGLSVPDWPTTYGWNMFMFPLSKMVGGIRYEHSHRLIASSVGFLTIVLTLWAWQVERRPWARRVAYAALGAVILQGLLGGLTVLLFLPPPMSIAHAGLAQIFFCIMVTFSVVTSQRWFRQGTPVDDAALRGVAAVTTVLVYVQILLGATMRHTNAGLAIPTFPLAWGHLIPPSWDARIAIHFAHRVGALVVALAVLATSAHVFYHHKTRPELVRPAILLLVFLATQITLGAYVVLSGKNAVINTAHVVNGALVLGTSLTLTLRSWRAVLERASALERSPDFVAHPITRMDGARP